MTNNPIIVRRLSVYLALSLSLPLLAADRITQPADPGRSVALRGHLHPEAVAANDRGAVDPTKEIGYVTLLMKPGSGLEAFLAEQRNPSSPNFHRWLTPEEFGDRFGLSSGDMSQVVAWLKSQGLRVHDVARGRHWVTFSGTARQLSRAFRTEVHQYSFHGETHFANTAQPSVPEAFQDVVAGVEGLSDFGLRPLYHFGEPGPLYNSSSGRHYLAPEDFSTIYNLLPLYAAGTDGTGQKIVVVGRTSVDVADIRTFRKRFNLPANDPQLVLFGTDPGVSAADVPEADLDLEWAGATAPNASIIYVYSTSITTSLQYAIDQNLAPVITESYGSCEVGNSGALRYLAQQANAQGITWLAASGDFGASTCDGSALTPQAAKGLTPDFPSTIPEITAVGGTEFVEGAGSFWASTASANGGSALSYIPETAWNDAAIRNDFAATAGGASTLFAKPVWQTGPGVPNDNARDFPDISFSASADHDSYLFVSNGSLGAVGGTSVGSPAFAGVVALLNQFLVSRGTLAQPGLGNINPTLYRLAQSTKDVFHDITTGDNKLPCVQGSPNCVDGLVGYSAGPGYDLVTGLGSADAFKLVTEWTLGTGTITTLTATPTTVDLTTSVRLVATVSGSGGVPPSGAVNFLSNHGLIGSAPLTAQGSAATATITVNAIQALGGDNTVTAFYLGDTVYDGSGGSVSLTLNLPASGSLVVPSISPNPVPKAGSVWPYTVTLAEKAGVATKLTGFTIDGVTNPVSFFGSGSIPANGRVSSSLAGSGLSVPVVRTFVLTGADADGKAWTQTITANFVGPAGPQIVPAVTLTAAPAAVQQDPNADPSCQWSQQLTIQEQSGYLVMLVSLTAGATSFTSSLQQIFGTTRLAPFGRLHGAVCFSGVTPPTNRTYTLLGAAENGATVSATLNAVFAPAPATPIAFTATRGPATYLGVNATTKVDLAFTGGSPQWSVAVSPANRTSTWLTVTPVSGTGNGQLTATATAAGLSNGVYNATLVVQAADSAPQYLNVPITFVVGSGGQTSIAGVSNVFSGDTGLASGMLASVYGAQLANTTQAASDIPLPLTMAGVSVTVNGISAPLLYVSPGQVNIQIPNETGSGPAALGLNNNGHVVSSAIDIATAAPGLWTSFVNTSFAIVNSAKPGDVLTTYMTGDGDLTVFVPTGNVPPSGTGASRLPMTRLPVTVTVGGVPATVLFSGNVQFVGVSQLNFTVPDAAPPGVQPVVVTVGGVASKAVNLTVNASSQQ